RKCAILEKSVKFTIIPQIKGAREGERHEQKCLSVCSSRRAVAVWGRCQRPGGVGEGQEDGEGDHSAERAGGAPGRLYPRTQRARRPERRPAAPRPPP